MSNIEYARRAAVSTGIWQSADKVSRLPDAEKRRKARKHRLQKRAHTQTYATDFAACVDEASRNFDLVRGLLKIFLRLLGLSAV